MGPLSKIRVLEFAGLGPVPFCGMMLSDMGADVLRIDRPQSEDPYDRYRFEVLNRGRKSVILDLKTEEGRQTALRLAANADILLEGFRPGVMEQLGLSPETCLQINPKLVFGRMTGWGQNGPLAHAAGHDINFIALSGALWSVGRKGESPVPPLNLVGDFGGGAMYLAFGVVCALIEATRSGRGQVVDAAMIDGVSSLMAMFYGWHARGAWQMARGENLLDTGAPWYDVYETLDREYVAIGPVEPRFYVELLKLLDLDPANLPAQYDRDGWPELRKVLAERFRTRTRAEWCDRLEGADACFTPVLSPLEAPDHPHMRERSVFIEVDGIVQPAPAPRFSRSMPETPTPPRRAGADTIAGLREWGIPEEEISELCEKGVAIQA
jgi:alpha-methylacyl-CoA racemase